MHTFSGCWTRVFNRLRFALPAIPLILVVLFMGGCEGKHFWTNWWTPGDTVDNLGYHPDQPIAFSHKLHAGKKADGGMEMSCNYCHDGARRSPYAGIPSSEVCMGCHALAATDSPEIQKLAEKHKNNEPIKWVKVHDSPDHVHFNHQPHIMKGFTCQECHGQVQEMTTASQGSSLQMGWCIDCHHQNGGNKNCKTCHY